MAPKFARLVLRLHDACTKRYGLLTREPSGLKKMIRDGRQERSEKTATTTKFPATGSEIRRKGVSGNDSLVLTHIERFHGFDEK